MGIDKSLENNRLDDDLLRNVGGGKKATNTKKVDPLVFKKSNTKVTKTNNLYSGDVGVSKTNLLDKPSLTGSDAGDIAFPTKGTLC